MGAPWTRTYDEDTVPTNRRKVDTLELPVVPAEPPPTAPAAAQGPAVTAPFAAGAPPAPTAPAPAWLTSAPAPYRSRPVPPRRRSGLLGRAAAVIAAAAVGVGVALGGLAVVRHLHNPSSGTSGGAALSVAAVRSVDPSGGSGFHQASAGDWVTQHYRTAHFGNLKPGVGLLLDLGSPQRVRSVSARVGTPGISVELRVTDAPGSAPSGWPTVATKTNAAGTVSLPASDGGKHRYWVLWVPRLASDAGGYAAELRGITVRR